ncbi:hypothetical protein Nhal_0666 [Nitrosococcus halophilus Nc 4]|uniref:Uncharacterized protein n=1 Tax=Nitrosococcus halophilus (strain Nc4) TaxID=472759 RepID=D5BWW5_NITHN|nr:hypothetical protein Nhal_0666 [Nitrosococcus halophilus Nc 4]
MCASSFKQHATVFPLPFGFLETILRVQAPAFVRGDLSRLLMFSKKSLEQQSYLETQKQLLDLSSSLAFLRAETWNSGGDYCVFTLAVVVVP